MGDYDPARTNFLLKSDSLTYATCSACQLKSSFSPLKSHFLFFEAFAINLQNMEGAQTWGKHLGSHLALLITTFFVPCLHSEPDLPDS
jgi:hypothetical protein